MKISRLYVNLIAGVLCAAGVIAGSVQMARPAVQSAPAPVVRDPGPHRPTMEEQLEEMKRRSVELAQTPEYREMVRTGCEQGLYKCD